MIDTCNLPLQNAKESTTHSSYPKMLIIWEPHFLLRDMHGMPGFDVDSVIFRNPFCLASFIVSSHYPCVEVNASEFLSDSRVSYSYKFPCIIKYLGIVDHFS